MSYCKHTGVVILYIVYKCMRENKAGITLDLSLRKLKMHKM